MIITIANITAPTMAPVLTVVGGSGSVTPGSSVGGGRVSIFSVQK